MSREEGPQQITKAVVERALQGEMTQHLGYPKNDAAGKREVLGLWTGAGEAAKFWLGILTELRNRGVRDSYVVCVDGLRGFPPSN